MLFDYNPRRERPANSIGWSMIAHVASIALVLWLCAPRYLHEVDSLHGRSGNRSAIALLSPGISAPFRAKSKAELQDKKLHLPPKVKVQKAEPTPHEASASTENKVADTPPGTQGGSLLFGLSSDHDVRIAYATFAPDPPINRAALPEWIRGDVVVEVAISDKGDVVETRVLKSLGFGLDDVIAQTLRQWRYQPARVDGRAVASKHDVYFHFPS
ncbi:MAG: energy transducer TonB [Terriglobales bacterium]